MYYLKCRGSELHFALPFAVLVLDRPTSTALGTFAATAAQNFRELDLEYPPCSAGAGVSPVFWGAFAPRASAVGIPKPTVFRSSTRGYGSARLRA